MSQSATPSYVETLCARQPIFTREQELWGYEFLYRDVPGAETADIVDGDKASLAVAAESLIHATIRNNTRLKICVNFTEALVLDGVPYALPPEQTVLEVPEVERLDPAYHAKLLELEADGYTISLDGFNGAPASEPLAALAGIIKIDVLRAPPADIQALCAKAAKLDALLLAKRIQDKKAFTQAREMGFKLFQGFFFMAPELLPGRKITANETTKLQLFKLLKEETPEFDTLAQAINADVSLSYRLLSLLNSPSFGLVREVRSIKQAVVFLGWKQLKSWLRVMVLTDLSPSGKPSELVVSSALRGRFLQNVAQAAGRNESEQDSMFMLGLFSLLDTMLGLPMDQLVDHLPLADELLDALTGKENRYSPWLELASTFERADWQGVERHMRRLDLEAMAVARAYRQAMEWSARYFQAP